MKRTLFIMVIAAVLLAACGARVLSAERSSVEPTMGIGGGDSGYVEEAYAPEAPLPQATMMPATSKAGGGNESAARDRMVVRNADLSIVVKDPETSMDEISKLAEEMGGFVVSSNLYQTYTNTGLPVPEASIIIRVPAEKLNETLEKIKADAVEVQSENQSGQDVTSEYVDLESQLKNLEAAEQQLMEIMSKAEKTEDVLNVFNQLTSIRGQIESIKGQMKYYEESAALSAISVRLIAEETIEPVEIGGWKPQGTARDAIQNLIYFWQDFVDFLIVFTLNFLPKLLTIALVFGLPIWLIVRAVRNARKRKAAQARKEQS